MLVLAENGTDSSKKVMAEIKVLVKGGRKRLEESTVQSFVGWMNSCSKQNVKVHSDNGTEAKKRH